MRGALRELPGVTGVMIREPIPDFRVRYDLTRTDVETILRALAAAGEPASPK